ncbi:MAG: hypothetical protein KGI58_03965 [Patescibacteria group bacterium]|nr:hypothetical protein [Patescibacteria group bacterium]
MTGDQWLGTLTNKPGVKPEEMQYTGLQDFLSSKGKESITKEEVQQHLANNKVQVNDVVKGNDSKISAQEHDEFNELSDKYRADPNNLSQAEYERYQTLEDKINNGYDINKGPTTKHHKWQLPGGDNYREHLLTLPNKDIEAFKNITAKQLAERDGHRWEDMSTYDRHDYQNLARQVRVPENSYKSSHWDEPNVLAHMRTNERDVGGVPSLHLEELQSDWMQSHRKELTNLHKQIDNDFDSIADRMVKAGVIKKVCD